MENMKRIKAIIVDDNTPFRLALKEFLVEELNIEVIAEASDGEMFLKLRNYREADVVLMDLMMPKTGGIDATKEILWRFPELRIIAITLHTSEAYLEQLIKAGFRGCVFKNNLFDEIDKAIHEVINGIYYFPDKIKLMIN